MLIDYTSDLHLDFILGGKGQYQRLEKIIAAKMGFKGTDADILVIAGDLGHYNKQNIEFLKYMAENHYRHVLFTSGNHDLYILTKSQNKKYKEDSFNRLSELQEYVDQIENVHYLDGNMVEIEGIKIAGSCLWYDYSYGLERGLQAWQIQEYFMKNSNDSKKIIKSTIHSSHIYDHFSKPKTFIDNLAYAADQKAKLLKVVKETDPNIILSHIPPDHELCEGTRKTKDDPLLSGSLYSTDTSDFDPYIQGKIWIFGHVHEVIQKEKRGCQFLAVPFGYYGREQNNPFGRIEIEKK